MLKSSKALRFLFLIGLATTVIGIPALLLFVVALKWVFIIFPAVFIGLVLLVSYIASICMLYDDIFGSGRDRRFLEAETIPISDRKEFGELYAILSKCITTNGAIYSNFAPICYSLDIPKPLNSSEIDIRLGEMFVKLSDNTKDHYNKLTPREILHLWLNEGLFFIQLDEDGHFIYNHDVFMLRTTDKERLCRLYIITHDGKCLDIVKDKAGKLVDVYNLMEVE